MSKQAASILALGIAGPAITCIFAFMFVHENAPAWGLASLIIGVATVVKLLGSAKSTD